jgi:hypothetical protein
VNARVAALPPRALVAIAAGVVLVYALALWFLVVSPKRSEAAALADDVVAAELRLADAKLQANRPKTTGGAQVTDLLRLAKAMPPSTDQPGLVLELDRLARWAGLTLGSISPRDAMPGAGGPTTIPVVVTAEGSYRQITRFLKRTRSLVKARGGTVRAKGRLFTVQVVELSESGASGFPRLDATITLNAFVYDGPIVPETPPPPAPGEDDLSTGTSAAGSMP